MRVTPEEIAAYVYCPMLLQKNRTSIVSPKLSFAEKGIRQAFIEGERNACLKDSIVDTRKLLRIWEKIWWPLASANKINLKDAAAISLKASSKFADYCKYDISDWGFPTAGVDIYSDVGLGPVIMRAHADIIKVDLDHKNPSTVIINFNTRKLSLMTAALDPAVLATAYAFYKGGEDITHISINISEQQDKLSMITSAIRPSDILKIEKMLTHVARGIRNKNYYSNPFLCKECKVCRDFIL